MSNSGVSGELRYFGSPVAEDAPAEADDAAARIADRDHQPPAEAVVGLFPALLGLDQHAGFDELVLAEIGKRALKRIAAVGGEADAETGDRLRPRCRGA